MGDGSGQDTARTLRAGPLTLVYEGVGLRWIRLGDYEVLRGIYVAVRDALWRTIPATVRDLTLDAREDSFRIELVAEHRHHPVDFRWRGTITGERGGVVTFTMDGVAQRSFLKNRIGLCVLHPMESCSGRPCTVEHPDGHIASMSFPSLVSPHQPFLEVRAIAHEPTPGAIAEVRVEGDTFETEDQRNWSDTSFKTYSTPVSLPFPVEIPAGARVRQEVRLRLRGATTMPVRGDAVPVRRDAPPPVRRDDSAPVQIEATNLTHALPRIGLALDSTQPLSTRETTRLRALGLAHLRVDLDLAEPHWRTALRNAAMQADAVGTSLQVAAIVSESPREELAALAEAAATLPAPIDAWLVFDRTTGTTPESLLATARELLAGGASARIGGGSNVHFADLNRNRPPAALLDLLAYPTTPQAHATDAETMVENIGSVASVADTARSFAPGVPIAITPVTLKPRARRSQRPNPGVQGPEPLGSLPDHVDIRQMSPFAAVWTASHLRACAEAGVESVTYFQTVGWDGVMEHEGGPLSPDAFPSHPAMLFPVYEVLADVGAFAGGRVLVMRSMQPQRVDALCLERQEAWRLLLVNLRAEPQHVVLPPMREPHDALKGSPRHQPGRELVLQGHEIRRFDFERPTKKGDSVAESPFK